MVRRIAGAVVLAIVGLLALPSLAFAAVPLYPAPPVTPNSAAVLANTGGDSVDSTTTVLASTGAGFSVTTAVLVAVLVLVAGVALLLVGNRVRRSGAHHD